MNWPDIKIRATLLASIRRHAMNPSSWTATILDGLHPCIPIELESGELPLVSAFHSEASWYVLTTRRVVGLFQGARSDIPVAGTITAGFGNFKGLGAHPTECMYLRSASGVEGTLEFETGSASMAPIYYFRYWTTKFPVIEKLRG